MPQDLSRQHQPLGKLFSATAFGDLDRYRLSEEQLAFFQENGYLTGVRILDEPKITLLRKELKAFFSEDHDGRELWYEYHANESADPSQVLFHALGAWRISPGFHDLLWHPAFTVPASQLLGGPVRFWHDQLFCKPANHGGVVAWHQDYSYWTRTKPMAHLTCWIGLDDSTKDNGCMHYIPGSHRWDLLPITGLAGDMQAIREVLNEDQWEQFQKPVAVELKEGEASFHHPLMIHGSFENSSEKPRRATVVNAVRDGVTSAVNEPLLEGTDAISAGEPLGGRFYPLLFDPSDSGVV